MKKIIEIEKEEFAGLRLDIALSQLIPTWSRSFIKTQIESNAVLVNEVCEYRANYTTKLGDKITVDGEPQEEEKQITPENIIIDIIYEDEDLIVINKPAGMVVHPSTGNWTGTVMNALMYHFQGLGEVGNTIRSGLIHRLDKDTSGVLLIGKTNKGLWHYTKLFSQRKVEKSYLACVYGTLPFELMQAEEYDVRNYIGRNKLSRKKFKVVSEMDAQKRRMSKTKFGKLRSNQYSKGWETKQQISLPADARVADTIFKKLDSCGNYHLLSAFPKTGRTHQIRVHCNYLNIPIIGDTVYGGLKNDRMMLHAYKLKIENPEGKLLEFKANLDGVYKKDLDGFGLNFVE